MLNLTLAIPYNYIGIHSSKNHQFGIHGKRGILFSPITSEYWKIEVQRLFKIRLARLQMDVVGIAQGLGHDLPEAVDELANRGQSAACRHIKTKVLGWKNISLAGLVGFLVLDFVVWLSTIKVGESVAIVWLTHSYLSPAAARLFQFLKSILLSGIPRNRSIEHISQGT